MWDFFVFTVARNNEFEEFRRWNSHLFYGFVMNLINFMNTYKSIHNKSTDRDQW